MFKAMIMLTRRADMTHEEFVAWWLDEHVPLASGLPNVRKVVLNVVDEGHEEAGIDGVSELWFDSRADFDAAYASEVGRATAADSLAHVSGRVRLVVTENASPPCHRAPARPSTCCGSGCCRRRPTTPGSGAAGAPTCSPASPWASSPCRWRWRSG